MSSQAWFEALERRVVLSGGDLNCVLYSPEGFAHDGVTEIVTIANLGDETSSYELSAHYERGERDALIGSGEIEPGESIEVVVSMAGDPEARLVRKATPYALELRSDELFNATFRHDDLGGTTVRAFQADTSTSWAFAQATKQGGRGRDFILLFNPNESPVEVTLAGVNTEGETFEVTQEVGARRRGGWNLMRVVEAPDGEMALSVSADMPIVVTRSHYAPFAGHASGQAGSPGDGVLAGSFVSLRFDDDLSQLGQSVGQPSYLKLYNPGDVAARVRLDFLYQNFDAFEDYDGPEFVDLAVPNIEVDAGATVKAGLRAMTLPLNLDMSMRFWSDAPVVATLQIVRDGQVFEYTAEPQVATEWSFVSEGVTENGTLRTETVLFYKPYFENAPLGWSVTITFTFSNGALVQQTVALQDYLGFSLDAEIVVGDEDVTYAVTVIANRPIHATLERIDPLADQGLTITGTPGGDVVAFSTLYPY